MKKIFLPLLLMVALAACSQTPPLPGQKLGKPYSVDGKTYYPEYDATYDKIGMASWYGPGFHGKYTASGEIYNQNDLTAAHPTLPMPSLVRVTNLANGKSLIVRINDRGPFKSSRIIDLSKEAAIRLGMPSTSQVRVQFLKDETEEYIASIADSKKPIDMFAYNEQADQPKEKDEEVAAAEPSEPMEQPVANDSDNAETSQSAPAPLVSVSESDLGTVKPAKHAKHGLLVKDAMAEETPVRPLVSASAATTMTSGAYAIQAGAFSTEVNAHKLVDKLSRIARPVVDTIKVSGKTLWRVRLGPFNEREEADDALDKVRASGLPDAHIVRL